MIAMLPDILAAKAFSHSTFVHHIHLSDVSLAHASVLHDVKAGCTRWSSTNRSGGYM